MRAGRISLTVFSDAVVRIVLRWPFGVAAPPDQRRMSPSAKQPLFRNFAAGYRERRKYRFKPSTLETSDAAIALIERFDRDPGGRGRKHYLSAQSFIGAFRGERRFYTDIADGLRAANGPALVELEEMHRRILFTILVSNTDDHLKNHGLLYDPVGGWALSPAFDINPQPFRHPQMKTGISELSGFEPSVEAWIEAAPFFEVTTSFGTGSRSEVRTDHSFT